MGLLFHRVTDWVDADQIAFAVRGKSGAMGVQCLTDRADGTPHHID
jgi:hypothetical protein